MLYMRLKDGLLWKADASQRRAFRMPSSVLLVFILASILAALGTFAFMKRVGLTEGAADQPIQLTGHPALPKEEFPDVDTSSSSSESSPPPKLVLVPIEEGRVGVAAVDNETLSWNGEVARILLRQLQQQRPDLQAVMVSATFTNKAERAF